MLSKEQVDRIESIRHIGTDYVASKAITDLLSIIDQLRKPSLLERLLKVSHIKLGGYIYLIDVDVIKQITVDGLKFVRQFDTFEELHQHLTNLLENK